MFIKRFLVLFLAFSFFVIQCEKKGSDQQLSDKGERVQKIIATFVLGKVLSKSENSNSWETVKVGKILGLNDTIRVSDSSRISLQSETGSVVVIKDSSEIKVNSVLNPKTGEENTEIALNTGKAVINPRKLEGNSKFAVRTPAMVAGVRGTVFSVEYRGGETKVAVQEGKVAIKPTVDKKIEPKIREVEVNPGEKAQVSLEKVEQISKKIESQPEQISAEKSSQEMVEVKSMNTQEKDSVEKEKQELVKLDLKMTGDQLVSQNDQKKEISLGSVTISSFGNEIYVNSGKVANDYYSSLYPQGSELNIEIKKKEQIILQQKVVVPEKGIELNLTPAEELNKEIDSMAKKDLTQLFIKVGDGFPANSDNIVKTSAGYAFIGEGLIKLSQSGSEKPIAIPYNMKVKPFVTGNAVFVVNKGNLEVYSPNGQKIGEAEVNNNIIFNTAITVFNNNAYMANSIGTIVGLSSDGKKIFSYSLKDAITAPVSVSENYLVTASPYKVYVIDLKNNNLISSFRPTAKVFKKIGILGTTLLIPQENNSIILTDLNGKQIKKIPAIADNIELLSSKTFMIKYSSKTSIFNTDGQKIKEVNTGKSFVKNGKLIYAEGKSIVIDDFTSEKKVELTESIKTIGDGDSEILALSESGKLYKINY